MARLRPRARRGIAAIYSSLIFLFLVFSILTTLISTYLNYNNVLQDNMKIEQERFLEQLVIANLTIDPVSETVTSLNVGNTGTIDVKIRAIYITNETMTYLVCDPSTYMDTNILPSQNLSIPLPKNLNAEPEAELTVVTERGVQTKQYEWVLIFGPILPPNYDPNILNIGPIQLRFDAFHYQKFYQNGTLDPDDYWHPGWRIDSDFGYCGWNLTIKNIGTKNITLNMFSSLTLSPCHTPANDLSWHLQPPNPTQLTDSLAVNQTKDVFFVFTTPTSSQAQKLNFPKDTLCMAFLTFFGTYSEHDGSTTPYAQTIPFEAVKVI